MWCEHCQADVATEISADHTFVRCAACGDALTRVRTDVGPKPTAPDRTLNARQLLERWSANTQLDPYGPTWPIKGATDSTAATESQKTSETTTTPTPDLSAAETAVPTPATTSSPCTTEDAAQPPRHSAEEPAAIASSTLPETTTVSEDFESADRQVDVPRVDAEHVVSQPHIDIDVAASIDEPERPGSNWLSWCGQLLAYSGVLGLTLGSSLVLWSHFGGPAHYAPTGWLITTAGQMLLFLGVITLVSSGLEHATSMLTHRMDRLGERILRFEEAARHPAGRGPRSSPHALDPARHDTQVDQRGIVKHNSAH